MRIAALIAVLACSACASVSSYETTAQRLTGEEEIEPNYGYLMQWRPLANQGTQNISIEEQVQSRETLSRCVRELKSNFPRAPSEAVQAVQLAQCMRNLGWHLVLAEFVLVGGT